MKTCTHQSYLFRLLKSLLLSLLLMSSAFAQDPPQYGTPYAGVPDRMDANIYQLNLREYSASRNIAGARANLQRIKDLGINVIYLMPIYPVGVTNNPDGSPYSHRDLKGIASDLGTLTDLRGLVDDAHAKGMAVILDFVVNQTAWDHPWITQHSDWYVKDGSGNIVSPCPSPGFCFNDVAEFNLNNSAAAAAMVDAMRYWIFAANIDGYRFDWADKSPPSFWTNTISNLRGITSHKLLLLAEGSNEGTNSGCTTCGLNQPGFHYQQGFDYIFGTNFYWNVMKKVWNAGEPVTNLNGVTDGEYVGASSTQLVARFLSNHDDYNADGSPFSFISGGRNAVMSIFVVASYYRGVPFIYNGIEVGNTNPLPYPWKTGSINWTQDPSVYTEMQKILNFRNANMAIKRGQPTSYTTSANNNVIAFTKIDGSEKVAVMVNVRNSTQNFTIPAGMAGTYTDAYTGAAKTLTSGATQSLTAYQYIVLKSGAACTPTAITPYVAINGGAFAQTATATLTAGGSVIFGPQPLTGGTWSWSGPNGYSSSSREITLSNVQTNQSGTYTATYTNASGCPSTQNFTLTVNPPPSNLPSPWLMADVGAVAAAGSASYASGTFTVNASGADVFDFADEFGFVYQSFSGNVTVTARVNSLTNTNAWAKAGVMIRESLNGNSSNAAMLLTPSNGFNFQYRNGTGAGSTAAGSASGTIPNWVRITRSGNTLTGFRSTDGTTWTQTGSVTITLPNSVYVGLFATSHNDGVLATATFTNVSVTGGANSPPTANAGADKSLAAGTTSATLPGSGSDPDGNPITYSWTKVSGPAATITNATSATATVSGLTNGSTYVFQLTVSDGSLTASDQVQVTVASAATYYAIRNRWQNNYLRDAGNNVGYGATVADNTYRWEKVAVDATYFWLRNVSTGHYMHIENQTGSVQCTSITMDWWSAQWSQETVDATYVRIRNRWQPGNMIHIENLTGSAQYANAQTGWFSAQWEFVPNGGPGGRTRTSDEISEQTDEGAILVELYPNPASGKEFTLQLPTLPEGDHAQITMQDIQGKVVYETTVHRAGIIQHNLTPGFYIVKVRSRDLNAVKKIMIK